MSSKKKKTKKSLRGSDGAELVDASASPKAKGAGSSFRPQSEWDDDGGGGAGRKSKAASSFRPQSEWDDGDGDGDERKSKAASSFRPQSEWDDGGGDGDGRKSKAASSFRPQSEWDDGGGDGANTPKQKKASSFRPQSEWDDGGGDSTGTKNKSKSSFRPQSEWDDGDGGTKAKAQSSARPQSEWDDAGEGRPQSEWMDKATGGGQKQASEWNSPPPSSSPQTAVLPVKSFMGDSFLLGASVYAPGQSMVIDAVVEEEEENSQPQKPSSSSPQKKKEKKASSFRPQSEWDAGGGGSGGGAQQQKEKKASSFRPQSEWDAGGGGGEKDKESKSSFRPQSEWGAPQQQQQQQQGPGSGGEQERQKSEWDSGGAGGGSEWVGSDNSNGQKASVLQPPKKAVGGLFGFLANSKGSSSSTKKSGAGLLGNLSLEAPSDPFRLFQDPPRNPAIAQLQFGGFDTKTGLPTTFNDGSNSVVPVNGRLLKELKREQAAMASRFAAWNSVVEDRARFLRGEGRELKPATAKALCQELRRIEEKQQQQQQEHARDNEQQQGVFVLDPRTMFVGGSSSGKGKGDGAASEQAEKVFAGMFSQVDEVGRATRGCLPPPSPSSSSSSAVVVKPPPLPSATVTLLDTAHKEQAQRFLDACKLKLDACRRRDLKQHFKQGKHAGKYANYNSDGLPVHDSSGNELGRREKEAMMKEQQKLKSRWEAEEEKLFEDMGAVARLYNQTTTMIREDKQLSGVLNAYASNQHRVADADRVDNELMEKLNETNSPSSKKAARAGANTSGGGKLSRGKLVRAVSLSLRSSNTGGKHLGGGGGEVVSVERRQFVFSGAAKAGMGLENDDSGDVVVSRVLEGSRAWEQGVQVGDRVISINNQPLPQGTSKQDALKALSEALKVQQLEDKKRQGGKSISGGDQGVVVLVERQVRGGGGDGGGAAASSGTKGTFSLSSSSSSLGGSKGSVAKTAGGGGGGSGGGCLSQVPRRDQVHVMVNESDRWSVFVVFLVLVDTIAVSPYRDQASWVDAVGTSISLFFLAEITTRLYLWNFVKGNLSTFFVSKDEDDGEVALWKRIVYLNIIDVVVVFVDILFLLVTLASSSSSGGSNVSVVRLSRLGRVFRYFRLAKNLRGSRLTVIYVNNAHLIYHFLLRPDVLTFFSALIVTDIALYDEYGGGGTNHQSTPDLVLAFGLFMTCFFLLETANRILCHRLVLGQFRSFFVDRLNGLDLLACFVDFIGLLVFAAAGVRGGASNTKALRLLRWLLALKLDVKSREQYARLRAKPEWKKVLDKIFPPRLTQQQKDDLELYGVYIEEADAMVDDGDVEIGSDVKKLDVREFDEDEVEGAWVPIKYAAEEFEGELAAHLKASKVGTLGLAKDGVLTKAERDAHHARGDQFKFNTLTGETKWEEAHHQKLARGRDHHAKLRSKEKERRVAMREMRTMAHEDDFAHLLRQHGVLAHKQWVGVFGSRLPFKHAGRYEIAHRGYRYAPSSSSSISKRNHDGSGGAGDGYGTVASDSWLGQGLHSRTFTCLDTTGPLGFVVVKVSRGTAEGVAALRKEAGVLASLGSASSSSSSGAMSGQGNEDPRKALYFTDLLDSFDFGPTANRFAIVFREHGPSLAYILSVVARHHEIDLPDPVYSHLHKQELFGGKRGKGATSGGLSESNARLVEGSDEAQQAAQLAEKAIQRAENSLQATSLTGYLHKKPLQKRTGPIPVPPLPLEFTVEVMRQLCDACSFLSDTMGMIHGDVTPDNIIFEPAPPRPSSSSSSSSFSSSFFGGGSSNNRKQSSAKPMANGVPAVDPLSSSELLSSFAGFTPKSASSAVSSLLGTFHPRIKLIDLNCSEFIPVNMPAKDNKNKNKVKSFLAGSFDSSTEKGGGTFDDSLGGGTSFDKAPVDTTGLSTGWAKVKLNLKNLKNHETKYFAAASATYDESLALDGGDPSNLLPSPLVTSAQWLSKRAELERELPQTSLNYRPPELDVMDQPWGGGVDSWGLGCVFAELFSGKADFFASYEAATSNKASAHHHDDVLKAAKRSALGEIGRAPLFRAESALEHLAMVERCAGSLPSDVSEQWAYEKAQLKGLQGGGGGGGEQDTEEEGQKRGLVGLSGGGIEDDEAARKRVEGVAPSIESALMLNRLFLAKDFAARKAILLGKKKLQATEGGNAGRHSKSESDGGNNPLAAMASLSFGSGVDVFGLGSGSDGGGEKGNTEGEDDDNHLGDKDGGAAVSVGEELKLLKAEAAAVAVEQWRVAASIDLAAKLLCPDASLRLTPKQALSHPALQTGIMAALHSATTPSVPASPPPPSSDLAPVAEPAPLPNRGFFF